MAPKLSIALLTLTAALQGAAQNFYPITGARPSQGTLGVPARRNINDLAAGGPQWDLYILALLALYREPDENPLSYFQISGIHGAPYIEWNGAGPRAQGNWGGYCPHNENLFLPWHRPYVALFEQVLVERARQIAMSYPERFRFQYVQAAESLRSPYWDWAADSRVPPSTVPPTVWVNYPNGNDVQQIEVENPLATYRFPRAVLDGKYGPFDSQRRPQVLRCRAPNVYPQSANALLSRRPLRQWVYDALTRARNFTEFSLGGGVVSLEQTHNAVHWDAACGEQFLEFSLTGFDPLFMLHHTNVDRIWAYWQTLRPDQDIFTEPYWGQARFSTSAGTAIRWDSPLQPFFDQRRAFHTPVSVRGIWTFGYTYEGLEWWRKSAEQMRQDAARLVNQLYGPRQAGPRQLRRRAEPTTRYFARLQLDVAELERPCMVSLYVKGTQVGSLAVMNPHANGTMETGFGLDAVVATDDEAAALVQAKVDGPARPSFEAEILKPDGSSIPVKSVTSLEVEVEAVEVTMPSKLEELPQYGQSRHYKAKVVQREGGKH
ncbi:hypothetical protein CDD83_8442 [Cordyceps sp. RAO-2017]|nr:hypothetical protein CDD83_8442 [Cordyceps sp. RAO-2017]